jgi:outer membrane protein assembly factor BamD (BamD/ComL family)
MAPSDLGGARGRRPAQIALGLLLVGGVAALLIGRRLPPVTTVAPSVAPIGTALDEEAQLMNGAEQALAAGDTDRAFSLLYEQATKFRKGRLADQRELTHMRTLCRAGKPTEARDEAASFLAQHPDSALVADVKLVCPRSP